MHYSKTRKKVKHDEIMWVIFLWLHVVKVKNGGFVLNWKLEALFEGLRSEKRMKREGLCEKDESGIIEKGRFFSNNKIPI